MGIYNLSNVLEKNTLETIKPKENIKINSIAIDGDNIIGNLSNHGNDKKNILKFVVLYYNFFVNLGKKCYLIFRDDKKIKKTKREKLKDTKTKLKAFTNRNSKKITDSVRNFLWKKLTSFIKINPISKNHKLYNFYYILYYKSNKLKEFWKKNSREKCLKDLCQYVFNNDIYKDFFTKTIIHQENIKINEIPDNFLMELSIDNYKKMCEKKLTPIINYVKTKLKEYKNINTIYTPYDPDDFIVEMKNINLIDTVVSTDTDFIASEVSMVTDINLEKETIFYVNSNYFYNEYKKNGYGKQTVKNAMTFSSADYNWRFYKERISFNNSLYWSSQTNNFYELYEIYCKFYQDKYNKNYPDKKTLIKESKELEKVYNINKPLIPLKEMNKILNNKIRMEEQNQKLHQFPCLS
jgi:hypothetical protein